MSGTKDNEANGWRPIETAPKNGKPILVLTGGDEIPDGMGGTHKRLPRAFIAFWNKDGDSWTDEIGQPPNDPNFSGAVAKLTVTGTWDCNDGWLQPDEVTHWCPIPLPPALPAVKREA